MIPFKALKPLAILTTVLLIALVVGTGEYWLGTRNTQPISQLQPTPSARVESDSKANTFDHAKTACEQNMGVWLSEFNECESADSTKGLDQEACTALGGTYNSCASHCRHFPRTPGSICIQWCVNVCKFQ
jgi:hypothetical protein